MAFSQFGIGMSSQGIIADQTLLLNDIRDGLSVYNRTFDPFIDMLSETTIRQTLRVSQAPKDFNPAADGGNPESQKSVFRQLNSPFNNYDLSTEFTQLWLQDALVSDVITEVNSAMLGDIALMNQLFYQAIFTKKTVGSIGTAYQAGFYNGETDVPPFKNNTFGSAHYHYLGLNHTTLLKADIQSMKHDLWEHGYGLTAGSLIMFMNTNDATQIEALMDTNASSTILQAITLMREKAIDSGVVNTGIMYDGVRIFFTDDVPAGYLSLIATDVKPIAKRLHPSTAYQGLMTFGNDPNSQYPLAGMKFLRRVGFAVQHLGAGTCRQLVGSATYTNPTFRLSL